MVRDARAVHQFAGGCRLALAHGIPPPGLRGLGARGPVEGDFVAQALFDLKSPALSERKQALGRLMRAPAVEEKRLEVAEAIEPMLRDPDPWVRTDAAKALAVRGGRENSPALIQAL